MSWPALAQSVPPTARALAWTPFLVATTVLLLIAGVSRLIDGRPTSLAMLTVATLAAVTLDATHDPAQRLLAPMPVSALARGLLRVVLVAIPAAAALVAVTALLPGGSGVLFMPGLALVLSGLALRTWLPPGRDIRIVAALPVTWVFLDLLLGSVFGLVGGITGWWYTDPLAVSAVALVAIGVGSRQ